MHVTWPASDPWWHNLDLRAASHGAHLGTRSRQARSLRAKNWSMSLFVIYFGLNRVHKHLKHHMVLFGPRYRDLIRDIFQS
ncbi:MAG: hypothetical protein ACNA7J_09410, partial [Wenzhouxiangella sp.]